MATTSTRFLMKVPDGTDTFDNDLHLKGNLNIIDEKAALKSESVASQVAGQRMEVVEITFTASGSVNSLTATGTFAKAFTSKPTIMPANITQAIGYSDTINYPHIPETSITLTNFTVTLKTAVTTNNFQAGTLKMKFLVFGV
jgi:hypothetical protein